MRTQFGRLNVRYQESLGKIDAEQYADFMERHLTPQMMQSISATPNRIRREATLKGIAIGITRALVKASRSGKTRQTALADLAMLQTAIDDEFTRLHDEMQLEDQKRRSRRESAA